MQIFAHITVLGSSFDAACSDNLQREQVEQLQ